MRFRSFVPFFPGSLIPWMKRRCLRDERMWHFFLPFFLLFFGALLSVTAAVGAHRQYRTAMVAQATVFFRDDAENQHRKDVYAALRQEPYVASVSYVSRMNIADAHPMLPAIATRYLLPVPAEEFLRIRLKTDDDYQNLWAFLQASSRRDNIHPVTFAWIPAEKSFIESERGRLWWLTIFFVVLILCAAVTAWMLLFSLLRERARAQGETETLALLGAPRLWLFFWQSVPMIVVSASAFVGAVNLLMLLNM